MQKLTNDGARCRENGKQQTASQTHRQPNLMAIGAPRSMVTVEHHAHIVLGIALVEQPNGVERGGPADSPFEVGAKLLLLVRLRRFQLGSDVLPLRCDEGRDCGIELRVGLAHCFASTASTAGDEGGGKITKH